MAINIFAFLPPCNLFSDKSCLPVLMAWSKRLDLIEPKDFVIVHALMPSYIENFANDTNCPRIRPQEANAFTYSKIVCQYFQNGLAFRSVLIVFKDRTKRNKLFENKLRSFAKGEIETFSQRPIWSSYYLSCFWQASDL